MKYINNIKESSVEPTLNVNRGGMKKKFQINALNKAARRTGKISKNIAIRETVTNKINATTLYPMNEENKKQANDIAQTKNVLNKYCLALVPLVGIASSIFTI
jgi:hypothetical protein